MIKSPRSLAKRKAYTASTDKPQPLKLVYIKSDKAAAKNSKFVDKRYR